MIGIGAPFVFGLAVLGALMTVVLHFLSVRRPPVLLLPTMRFLPDRPVRAVSRSARPSDPLLLLLRVLALLLIGVALAGVTWRGTGVKYGRVVVLQRGALEDGESVRQVVADVMRGGASGDTATALVVVDSTAHLLSIEQSLAFKPETLSVSPVGAVKVAPIMSTAILAGVRAAGSLLRDVPTVEVLDLVVAAPLSRNSLDDALPVTRAMWAGPIRVVDTRAVRGETVAPTDSTLSSRAITFAGEKPNDAVASAFATRGWLPAAGGQSVLPAQTNSVPPISVEWPASGVPAGWTESPRDTNGAIVARGSALVFPFVRTARAPEAVLAHGRAIAWWSDGAVAAIEVPTVTACTRHVGISIPASSDVLHGQAARALLLALSAPCGGETDFAPPLNPSELRALQGTGALATADNFRSATVVRTRWAPLLLLLALALLGLEWYLRDREEKGLREVNDELAALRKVA